MLSKAYDCQGRAAIGVKGPVGTYVAQGIRSSRASHHRNKKGL